MYLLICILCKPSITRNRNDCFILYVALPTIFIVVSADVFATIVLWCALLLTMYFVLCTFMLWKVPQEASRTPELNIRSF